MSSTLCSPRPLRPLRPAAVRVPTAAAAAGLQMAAAARQAAAAMEGEPKQTVLVDARNAYESAIGHFEADNVELLDPHVRCFSDTPAWLDANQHRLANRRILMYCTGGVRCERASAYLMSLGRHFQDVMQLRGGIQRYLEAFPDGGFFRGKNFVFDERVDVQGGGGSVVGCCVACRQPWDDYAHRRRCAACRMLLLVCDSCAAADGAEGSAGEGDGEQQQQDERLAEQQGQGQQGLICELCQQRQQQQQQQVAEQPAAGGSQGGAAPRRLRILCLHGFRQSGRNFEGRTHGFRRRLKDVAEFVFGDAPHCLPAWTKAAAGQPSAGEAANGGVDGQQAGVATAEQHEESGQQQQRRREKGQQQGQQEHRGAPRRAWLLTPEQYASQRAGQEVQQQQQIAQQQAQPPAAAADNSSCAAPAFVDDSQYLEQTAGWEESAAELARLLREQGPFDGLLGFSQGAAVAAVLAAQQAQRAQQQAQQTGQAGQAGQAGREPSPAATPLRFAILCSGYRSAVPEHRAALQAAADGGGAALPTLHIYGCGAPPGGEGGGDRQVSPAESAELADCFDPMQRFVVRHESGHLIPSSKTVVARVRDFLAHVQKSWEEKEEEEGRQAREEENAGRQPLE